MKIYDKIYTIIHKSNWYHVQTTFRFKVFGGDMCQTETTAVSNTKQTPKWPVGVTQTKHFEVKSTYFAFSLSLQTTIRCSQLH